MISEIKVSIIEQKVTDTVRESQKSNEIFLIKHSKIDTSDETNSFERVLILNSIDDFFNVEFYSMTKRSGKYLMVYYDDTLTVRLKTESQETHIWEIYLTEKDITDYIDNYKLKRIPFGDKVSVTR